MKNDMCRGTSTSSHKAFVSLSIPKITPLFLHKFTFHFYFLTNVVLILFIIIHHWKLLKFLKS